MKTVLWCIAQFVLLMCGIQAARAALTWGLWTWLRPAADSSLWGVIDILAFTVVGIALLLIFRPARAGAAVRFMV